MSLTWNCFFQIPYWPIILDGWRLDREDTLRLQRDYRDSTRETTERDSTKNSSNETEDQLHKKSFQRLDPGSRENRQRTKRELSYGDTSL